MELTPELLINAYCQGWFPMAESRQGPVLWCNPPIRGILPLEEFHVPHGLRRRLKKQTYDITRDEAFAQVIAACAQPRAKENQTWINDEIIAAYTHLHTLGLAHSVEAWVEEDDNRRLVGGLYGVAVGSAFFGESMFSIATDASKVCLVALVQHLRKRGYVLLDAQFHNPHLAQFGLVEISSDAYLIRLEAAVKQQTRW